MESKPLIGISACLLGQSVRYDGGHKLVHYLRDTLGTFVDFVAICPEHECGMPIPREAIRLVQIGSQEVSLQTNKTEKDKTKQLLEWSDKRLLQLSDLQLCGYIFKAKSPSCGLYRVKVYDGDGQVLHAKGRGLYAQRFVEQFPLIPVEEEGRLYDNVLRENFIERIFATHRWNELHKHPKSIQAITDFHASYKYVLMAHSPQLLKELGAFLAHSSANDLQSVYDTYFKRFLLALEKPATVKQNTNVLEHLMGYFKKYLSSDEKEELHTIIHQYYDKLIPLIVPVTLLKHFTRKYKQDYLLKQYFLEPHPMELMLRNHV